MIRTVIAMSSEAACKQIADTLEKNGVTVRYRCRTGGEAVRAVKEMGGGVIICGHKLPDMTADELSQNIAGLASLLVVAKPNLLDLCGNSNIFKLSAPVNTGELIGAVNMLLQMDNMRGGRNIKRRGAEEEALISRAKELLMNETGMAEPDAYHYIQRKSMGSGTRMAETAEAIIESTEKF